MKKINLLSLGLAFAVTFNTTTYDANAFNWFGLKKETKQEDKKETKAEVNGNFAVSDSKSETAKNDTIGISSDVKNAVVVLKDGTVISEQEVQKDLNEIPDQLASKMSLMDLKALVSWKLAYQKVMASVAKKSGIESDNEAMMLINQRITTMAGMMLMEKECEKLMTFEELQKHYKDIWEKNFKGTKEFTLSAVVTTDKSFADNLKTLAKDETTLQKEVEAHASTTKIMPIEPRSEKMFPPEVANAVMQYGEGKLVGPFENKGTYMLFFVKKIGDAKMQPFTAEFAENYKKVASKDFVKKVTESLYQKYNVKIYDYHKKPIDPFNIIDPEKIKNRKPEVDNSRKELAALSDADVLADMKGSKITVADVKKFFKVESIVDDTFVAMAQQFGIKLFEVICYATKLAADDRVLSLEVAAQNYAEKTEVKEKLELVRNMELIHAFYKKSIKIKPEQTKAAYNKFIKSIPEEDKNDHEISVKLLFFSTKEDAAKNMKMISSGEEKFNNIYKASEKSGVDLGYVKKQGTTPELWTMLKAGASGSCCKEILEINGSQFGVEGKNYAIAYIADRRPVQLPSLSNPQEKKYFEKMAEREAAVKLAKTHMLQHVKTISGKDIAELERTNPEMVDNMINPLVGYQSVAG